MNTGDEEIATGDNPIALFFRRRIGISCFSPAASRKPLQSSMRPLEASINDETRAVLASEHRDISGFSSRARTTKGI